MSRTAENVMQRSVVGVSAETPLADVQRLFVEEGIHGAPVLDEDDSVLGVITSHDLLRAADEERNTASTDANYLRDMLEFSGPDWSRMPEDLQDRLAQRSVEEVMTREVISVLPDVPVSQVAATMRGAGIHRVFVIDDGKLLGVISSFDLLECLEKTES